MVLLIIFNLLNVGNLRLPSTMYAWRHIETRLYRIWYLKLVSCTTSKIHQCCSNDCNVKPNKQLLLYHQFTSLWRRENNLTVLRLLFIHFRTHWPHKVIDNVLKIFSLSAIFVLDERWSHFILINVWNYLFCLKMFIHFSFHLGHVFHKECSPNNYCLTCVQDRLEIPFTNTFFAPNSHH